MRHEQNPSDVKSHDFNRSIRRHPLFVNPKIAPAFAHVFKMMTDRAALECPQRQKPNAKKHGAKLAVALTSPRNFRYNPALFQAAI